MIMTSDFIQFATFNLFFCHGVRLGRCSIERKNICVKLCAIRRTFVILSLFFCFTCRQERRRINYGTLYQVLRLWRVCIKCVSF